MAPAALAVLAVIVAACSSGNSDPDTSITPQHDAMAAAVRVEAVGCSSAGNASVGAGSFIAAERIITVAHVVAGSTSIQVVLADGRHVDATVTAIDRQVDLAILDVEVEVPPLPRGRMSLRSSGQFVVYRADAATAVPFTVLSAGGIQVPDVDQHGSSHRLGYELAADVLEGDSGSVLVVNGTATGVVFARSAGTPGRAWAVDIGEADRLLQGDHDVAVDTGACVAPPH